MANIEQDLQAIMQARYGKDVRQSIHDAISDINDVNEANISTVQGIADTAQGYANDASQAKTDAQTAQTGAETAQTHAETAEDGAEHFYQETLAIAQALGSALIPRGTVEFEDLPSVSSSEIKDGYMWNISDPFTTTSDFVEGAGLSIPMGANVYRITINNVPKWDILAGSSAQVYTGTEAQIAQAIQQGLLGEGVMINSLDDGEDELLTTSMIYHNHDSLENKLDDIDSDISQLESDLSDKADTSALDSYQLKGWSQFGSGSSGGVHEFDLPSDFNEIMISIGSGTHYTDVMIYPFDVPLSSTQHRITSWEYDSNNKAYVDIGFTNSRVGVTTFTMTLQGVTSTDYSIHCFYR